MKILNRKDFLALPKGVLYSHYNERNREFCDFSIKDGTIVAENGGVDDWVHLSLVDAPSDHLYFLSYKGKNEIDELIKNKDSFNIEYKGYTRDGFYNEEEYFAVYEKEDLTKLIDLLGGLIGGYPSI